jgi:tetratricopeptide (TPR) repeat protein
MTLRLLTASCFLLLAVTGCGLPDDGYGEEQVLIRQLANVLGGVRPLEPRLSGFDHAPCTRIPSGGLVPESRCAVDLETNASVFEDLAELTASIKSGRTPSGDVAAPYAAGLVHLVWQAIRGDSSELSVIRFQDAIYRYGERPRLLSDLAAAYLVRAATLQEPDNLFRALDAASLATDLDPELAEAQFNKALALERLHLQSEAQIAWRTYFSPGAPTFV